MMVLCENATIRADSNFLIHFPVPISHIGQENREVIRFYQQNVVGWVTGYGVVKTLLLIALPIMGGGMGAGAVPLPKIFESSGTMTAQEAMSIMTPAVAIGNALSIVMGGLVVRMFTSKTMNGQGFFVQSIDFFFK